MTIDINLDRRLRLTYGAPVPDPYLVIPEKDLTRERSFIHRCEMSNNMSLWDAEPNYSHEEVRNMDRATPH